MVLNYGIQIFQQMNFDKAMERINNHVAQQKLF